MQNKLTPQESNSIKWELQWESMVTLLQKEIDNCMFLLEKFSISIMLTGSKRYFQIYGAKESYTIEDNTKVIIKAINPKTCNFVNIYEYSILTKETHTCSQAYLIHNMYTEEELITLNKIRDMVIKFYQPNSIKFIME